MTYRTYPPPLTCHRRPPSVSLVLWYLLRQQQQAVGAGVVLLLPWGLHDGADPAETQHLFNCIGGLVVTRHCSLSSSFGDHLYHPTYMHPCAASKRRLSTYMVAEPLHRLVAQPGREAQGSHSLAALEGVAERGGWGWGEWGVSGDDGTDRMESEACRRSFIDLDR